MIYEFNDLLDGVIVHRLVKRLWSEVWIEAGRFVVVPEDWNHVGHTRIEGDGEVLVKRAQIIARRCWHLLGMDMELTPEVDRAMDAGDVAELLQERIEEIAAAEAEDRKFVQAGV